MLVYDIIIVGGGLVGAGLAVALRNVGLRIALVDARIPQNNDARLFALNAGSCEFLDNINVWSSIVKHASLIKEVHVSSRGHFGVTRLKNEDADLASLGYVIPAHFLEKALNQAMMTIGDCDIYRPATLHTMTQELHGTQLVISTETGDVTLFAGIIIGTDGADSTVRKLANISCEFVDYQQSAIVTRTKLSRSHHHVAYERFTDDGTIAMLPLQDDECATIWSGDTAIMDGLLALDDSAFLQELQTQFGYRLGRLQSIAKRFHYPLRMVRAETMVKGNVLLLGNAAHTLHPVAAQGFNLALYEVAVLVDALIGVQKQGKMLTAVDLQAVYTVIKQHQTASIRISHRLASCLTDGHTLLSRLMPIGLMGLDLATPLRRRFVRKIMGRTGRVPRLLMSANK